MGDTSKTANVKVNVKNVDIPWEFGSNRFASQKGMSPFGGTRSIVPKVTGARSFTENDTDSIPKLAAGCTKADPKAMPFVGGTRENVKKMLCNRETLLMKDGVDPESATFLTRWNKPNSNSNNADIGRKRDATTEVLGQGRHDKRTDAVLPRLQDFSATVKPTGTGAGMAGHHNQRQVTTKIEGGVEMSFEDSVKSKGVLPWSTSYQSAQSQTRTGGFLKPRDVVNATYYDTKKPMTSYKFH